MREKGFIALNNENIAHRHVLSESVLLYHVLLGWHWQRTSAFFLLNPNMFWVASNQNLDVPIISRWVVYARDPEDVPHCYKCNTMNTVESVGWGVCSVLKRTFCSYRGPKPSVTSFPGNLTPSFVFCGCQAHTCFTDIHTGKHSYK